MTLGSDFNLNQNSQVMRYQSARESATTSVEINLASMDPGTAEALAKAYRGKSKLSDADLLIVDSYVFASMTLFQQDFLEYREGLQPDEWWSVRERNIRMVLSTDWTRKIWSNYTEDDFLPSFHQEVAGVIRDSPPRDYYQSVAPSP